MTVELYIGRQPILDQQLEVVGYELLFRQPGTDSARFEHADLATAQVITATFMEIGLEDIVGSQPAFLNLTRAFLTGRLPLPLSPDQVALEVTRADIRDQRDLDALRALKARGYRLVLDAYQAGRDPQSLLELAQTVKFDVRAGPEESIRESLVELERAGVGCIAFRVESQQTFQRCLELGFRRFQGYFFCRPRTVSGPLLPANSAALLAMVSQLDEPAADLDDLERVVVQDPVLCYRLLRYINCANFALRREINTVREALILLGTRVVRQWATLMLLSELAYAKPAELFKTALVRARFCQRLANELGAGPPGQAFSVGLLSTLDAALDRDMADILDTTSLSAPIKLALLDRDGPAGTLLDYAIGQERGEPPAPPVDASAFNSAYLDALAWAEAQARLLSSIRRERPSIRAQ